MSIKIYSLYDEFKYEEPELCQYIKDSEYNDYDLYEEEEDDTFIIPSTNSDFRDYPIFYIISDLEDGENAENIAEYLGESQRIDLLDFHKILFCVK